MRLIKYHIHHGDVAKFRHQNCTITQKVPSVIYRLSLVTIDPMRTRTQDTLLNAYLCPSHEADGQEPPLLQWKDPTPGLVEGGAIWGGTRGNKSHSHFSPTPTLPPLGWASCGHS